MKSNKRNGKQKLSRSSFSELKTRALDYGAIVASKLPRAWRKYPGAPVVAIHSWTPISAASQLFIYSFI